MKEQNKNISLSLEEITYLQDYLLDEIQMLASIDVIPLKDHVLVGRHWAKKLLAFRNKKGRIAHNYDL